jgi:hypothetical protein
VLSDTHAIDLRPLARDVCERFYRRFPEELERSGEDGAAWCRHDNLYLLAWAIQEARDGTVVLVDQAIWLARVLANRDFPLALLVGNLELAAEVVRTCTELGALAGPAADALTAGAAAVEAMRASTPST